MLVSYWIEFATESMWSDYAELPVLCLEANGYMLNGILSIADLHVFVIEKMVEVDKVAPSGGS